MILREPDLCMVTKSDHRTSILERACIIQEKITSAQVKIQFRPFSKQKKMKIFRFLCCSTHRDLSIDVSITNVGLILTKLWWFLIWGNGQTDRHNFGILIMETGRHTKIRVDAIFKLYLYNITVFKLLFSL